MRNLNFVAVFVTLNEVLYNVVAQMAISVFKIDYGYGPPNFGVTAGSSSARKLLSLVIG